MKARKKLTPLEIVAIALLIVLPCCKGAQQRNISPSGEMVNFKPSATDEVLTNPGKGWVLYNKPSSFPPEILNLATVGFHRFHWADFEPEEGKYDWRLLDQYIDAWSKAGKKFAFGIMNLNAHNKNPFSTPEWVFKLGAKYRIEEIKEVKLNTTGVPGQKAIPVFDDPVYLQKFEVFLQALGKRYDGDPNIAFIDIRSYGNWGEGHMYPFMDAPISAQMFQKHIQLHREAFKKTLLILPWGIKEFDPVYDWAVSQGIGIRRDGIGGNSDGSETIRCIGKTPAVFELFGSYDFHKERGWWEGKTVNNHGYKLEDCVERGKPSYIGMREADVKGYLAYEMPMVRKLANRMGYHFLISNVRYPSKVQKGKHFKVQVEALNKGVAYQFEPCFVAFSLIDGRGHVEDLVWADAINTHNWAPDKKMQEEAIISFAKAKEGTYTFAMGLFRSKEDASPVYKLGIAGPTEKGWHLLKSIRLQ